jgi:hypothetical protein
VNLSQKLDTAGRIGPVPVPEARSLARWRVFVAWLVPDLALTFALVTVVSMFVMFHGATTLFNDTDTGWHIRNGERMLGTGLLTRADPYSFSKPGQPWIAWEWGADLLMGAVYRVSGLGGIAVMYGLCIAASVWMWFRLNHASEGNFLIACLFFVPMVTTTALHWLARPHIFSWLFLLGTVWLCERMPRRPGWQHFTLAFLATAAWSNLHGSFFFAPLIALIYAAGAFVTPLIWESTNLEDGGSMVRGYVLLALVASAGTLMNPYGWRLHQHVFSYLFNSGLLDRITEFQSFNFHQQGAALVMATLVICFAGAFASLAIHKPQRVLLSMLLTAIALRSIRALPVAALLLLPLANGSVTAVCSRASGLTPWLRRKLDDALSYGDRLQVIDRRLCGYAIVPFAALLIFASIRNDAGFSAADSPVAASVVVASLPADARILASDSFGGYFIYRFNSERKVFFDGRSDYYGMDFVERYMRLVEARPGWRDEFNRWNFTHALLPPDCPLIPALEAGGWREIHRDPIAVLMTGESHL